MGREQLGPRGTEGIHRREHHPPGLLGVVDHTQHQLNHLVGQRTLVERDDTGPAHPWVTGLEHLQREIIATQPTNGAGGVDRTEVKVGMVGILQEEFVLDAFRLELAQHGPGCVIDQVLTLHIMRLAAAHGRRFEREELLIGRGAPGAFGELVRLAVLGLPRAVDAEMLAGHRVVERHADGPGVGGIVATATDNTKRAIEAAGEIEEPCALIHELAVALGRLLDHQPHRRAAPDLTDATAGVTVQHPGGGVEAGHGRRIARLGVGRLLTLGCERGGRRHGEGQPAILAVIGVGRFRQAITIRDRAVPGIAVEVLERALKRELVDLGAALLGQQQEGHAMHAGRIHVSAGHVVVVGPALLAPGAIVERTACLLGVGFDRGQNHLIARAEIVLT